MAIRMSPSVTPTTKTLWASWATVDPSAPVFNLKPRTNPTPTLPVARCRSTTTSLRISRLVSATTSPSSTFGATMAVRVTICCGTISMTLIFFPPAGPNAEVARLIAQIQGAAGQADFGRRPAKKPPVFRNQHALFVNLADGKFFQVVEHDKVRPEARRDGAEVLQTVMPRGVDGGDLQRADGRQAEPDGLAHAMVNVTFVHQVAGELVVGGEGAVLRVVRIDERQQVRQISFRAAFAQENVHAEAQLFLRE